MASSSTSAALVKGKGLSSSVDRQLTVAIADFKKILTAEQRQELEKLKGVPDADSVLVFTAELDSKVQTTRKSVAGRLYPALTSIRDFCAIVDTFVSSKPEIAALVWGSLKLTIFVFTGSATQISALTDLFKFLQDASPRFLEYQALFPESSPLQEAVCNFHASVINCCSYLVKSIQLPWHGQLKHIIWESFKKEIDSHKDEIRRRNELVRYTLEIAKMQADRQEQQFQVEERKNSSLLRKAVEASVDFQRMQLEKAERLIRAQRRSLLESLSDHNHLLPWRQNRDKWQPGTFEWLFGSPAFNNWMNGSAPPVLWCSGKIGSGKTVLSAKVIDHLLTLKQHQSSDTLVTFFFMRFDHSTSLDSETVLRSLIRQALDEASLDPDLVTQLEDLEADHFTDQEKLREFLEQRAKQWKLFFVVIDGFDECDKSQRKSLLTALSKLSARHEGLRLLLAGRDSVSGSVRAAFPQVTWVTPYMKADMAKFVNASIQARVDDMELVVGDKGLVNDIKTALVRGADRMYIWVVFQIDEICLQSRDEDIRKTITDLPRDLKKIFHRVLQRISSHDRASIVRAALSWAAVAKEPLTKNQLRDALSIDIGQESLNSQKNINDIDNVILRCENLLQVDEEFGIIQFAHSSILQFLQEPDLPATLTCYHINMPDAEHHAGEICVTYLNLNDFKTTLAKRKKPSELISPAVLLQVALRTGGIPMAMGAAAIESLSRLGKTKLTQKSAGNYPIESLATFGRADADTSQSLQERYPFLQYAGRWWIIHSKDFDENKSRMWHAWHQMLTQGHELAHMPWKDLILHPLDVDVLRWCAKFDHVAIIQYIATHPSLTEMDKIDLAHFSAGEGLLQLFRSLEATLSGEAKLKVAQLYRVQDAVSQASSCLAPAPEEGSPENNVDINASGSAFKAIRRSEYTSRFLGESTALHAAAWGGHTTMVEILLLMGADPFRNAFIRLPEAEGSSYERLEISTLQLAVINNKLDVIKRLLPAADRLLTIGEVLRLDEDRSLIGALTRRTKDKYIVYSMLPLHRAVYSGCSLEILDFLLERGADVSDDRDFFGTPLHIAASRGDLPMVARLLAAGAKINERMQGSSMPDMKAFLGDKPYQGNNPFLRENVPSIYSPYTNGTALELAALHGHLEVVDRLLIGGANSEGLDTLVHEMRRDGRLDVVDRLKAAINIALSYR